MNRTLALLLGLSLMCAGPAGAQALDKKQSSTLNRLANQIGMLERSVEPYGPGKRELTQRQIDDFDRRVGRLEEMLAGLPPEQEDVKREAQRLAALKATLGAGAGALASKQRSQDEERATLSALLQGPTFEADLEALRQLDDMFDSASHYDLGFYIYRRWPTHTTLTQLRDWSQGWPAAQRRWAELSARYAPAVAHRGRLDGQAQMSQVKVAELVRRCEERYERFRDAIDAFAKGAPARIEKDGAELKAEAERAVAAKSWDAFIANEGKIEGLRYRVENLAAVWRPLASSEAEGQRVADRSRAILDEVDATMEKLAAAIIKENKGPKDHYRGEDRGRLEALVRAQWAKSFPKESVVAVRFCAEAFERHVAWRYDDGAHAFVKSDSSSLPVWVVVKDGAKQAIMWPATVHKQNLRGGELSFSWIGRPSRGAPPDRRLLLANL